MSDFTVKQTDSNWIVYCGDKPIETAASEDIANRRARYHTLRNQGFTYEEAIQKIEEEFGS